MGHADSSVDNWYREHIDGERLLAVAGYVRRGLFGQGQGGVIHSGAGRTSPRTNVLLQPTCWQGFTERQSALQIATLVDRAKGRCQPALWPPFCNVAPRASQAVFLRRLKRLRRSNRAMIDEYRRPVAGQPGIGRKSLTGAYLRATMRAVARPVVRLKTGQKLSPQPVAVALDHSGRIGSYRA